MTSKARIGVFIGLVLAVLVGAGGYVAYAVHDSRQVHTDAAPVSTRDDLDALTGQPHLVFRSTALGNGYGTVAMVPLNDPGGPRAITAAPCERVYAALRQVLCLSADRGLVTTYKAEMLGADFSVRNNLPLTGLPSRARLSPDGTLAATTTFVFGDSYTNPGQFSTRTLITAVDGSSSVDLETFALSIDGQHNNATDRNLWGVTFVDDDRFYATAATGGRTWLVEGSLSRRELVSVLADVECPSLSPDRTRIAFKSHGQLAAGKWRLAVVDLATRTVVLSAEQRSVDDQVEWLDNTNILYGLPRDSEGTATSDIWVVPADGQGSARVFVADAWSPAVVR